MNNWILEMIDIYSDCGTLHEFTLVLGGATEITEPIENALFDAGCDDATLSLRYGRLYLTFSRQSQTLHEAILSAISDVANCGQGIRVVRVDVCNLVTQADIARNIGRSRQLVHQYISGMRGPGGFPAPVCNITDDAPLWYWCEVAQWLHAHDLITPCMLRRAQEIAVINSVLELENQRLSAPALTTEVMNSICGCNK